MGRKSGYIFTNKKHSNRAIMATILGVISTLSLIAVLYLTYARGGIAPVNYGWTGLFIAIFSLVGLILAVMTALEKDLYRLFSTLGIVLNLVAFVGIILVVYAGMYL